MTVYVYSTLGQDNIYTIYTKPVDLPIVQKQIYIKGGVGVIDKNLLTPRGVRTEISDEDYEYLKQIHTFNEHIKNGFIVVEKSKEKAEKVAAREMHAKDGSAQKTSEDFEKERDTLPAGMRPAAVKKQDK